MGDSLSTALRLDIYASTHPLVNDIQRTADIEAAFDGITYKKVPPMPVDYETLSCSRVHRCCA